MTDEPQEETQEMVPLRGLDKGFRAEIRHRVENAPNITYITGLDKVTVLDLLSSIDHLQEVVADQFVERIEVAKEQLEAHADANQDGYLEERDSAPSGEAGVAELVTALGHIRLWVQQALWLKNTTTGANIEAEIKHVLENK